MGMNRGVTELKHGKFWDKIHMKLMQTDTNNCLLQNRPDSAQDLLRKIFVMEPRNSLNVKEIASHPWLKGPVPSDEEMASELKRRFKVCSAATAWDRCLWSHFRTPGTCPSGFLPPLVTCKDSKVEDSNPRSDMKYVQTCTVLPGAAVVQDA